MFRGQTRPLICLAEDEPAPTYAAVVATNAHAKTNPDDPEKQKDDPEQGNLDVVNGAKKDKGKGKAYGSIGIAGSTDIHGGNVQSG